MLLPLVDRLTARVVGHWALESQLGSRRNAMLASTALTQRRIERQDVEAFLSAREARHPAAAAPREPEVTAVAR